MSIGSQFQLPLTDFDSCRQFDSLRVLLEEEHVDNTSQADDSRNEADRVDVSGGQSAKLVDHEGDHIGKSALIADGEPGPFHVVHLTPDRADRGKAGGAEQVEH